MLRLAICDDEARCRERVAAALWLTAGCLAVQVTNACTGQVAFENGIPVNRRAGHGLGAYSIATLAEKHGGTADFSCRDGVFTVRAVL